MGYTMFVYHLGDPELKERWERMLRIKPHDALAHYNLGIVLERTGEPLAAIAHYEQALRIQPDYTMAHYNLAETLEQVGRVSEAIEHYQQALRVSPGFAEAHYNLATALLAMGNAQEAAKHLERFVELNPDSAEAQYYLAEASNQTGRPREAIGHYEQALRLQPDFADAYNNLAWLLATHTPAEGGDAIRAVDLAQRACELTGDRRAGYLDTLAAAYAAAGRFREAVATAQKAVELARAAGRPKLAGEVEARLELYRSGRAYFQPVGE
jgi:tetratricopeptide (TPR) repeat protein